MLLKSMCQMICQSPSPLLISAHKISFMVKESVLKPKSQVTNVLCSCKRAFNSLQFLQEMLSEGSWRVQSTTLLIPISPVSQLCWTPLSGWRGPWDARSETPDPFGTHSGSAEAPAVEACVVGYSATSLYGPVQVFALAQVTCPHQHRLGWDPLCQVGCRSSPPWPSLIQRPSSATRPSEVCEDGR